MKLHNYNNFIESRNSLEPSQGAGERTTFGKIFYPIYLVVGMTLTILIIIGSLLLDVIEHVEDNSKKVTK